MLEFYAAVDVILCLTTDKNNISFDCPTCTLICVSHYGQETTSTYDGVYNHRWRYGPDGVTSHNYTYFCDHKIVFYLREVIGYVTDDDLRRAQTSNWHGVDCF